MPGHRTNDPTRTTATPTTTPANAPAAPPTPEPPPAAPDARELNAHDLAVVESVEAEAKEVPESKTPPIDTVRVRTRSDAILAAMHPDPTSIRPGAPLDLPGLCFVFLVGIDALERAARHRGRAVHGRTEYGPRAKLLAEQYAPLLHRLRKRAKKRLKKTATKARAGMAVGRRNISVKSPMTVYDALAEQLETCRNPAFAADFAVVGLSARRWAEVLAPAVAELGVAVRAGMRDEVTVTDSTATTREALVRMDIALSRAVVWLEDWVSEAAGAELEALIPLRHKGGGAADEEDEDETDDESVGESDDGEGEEGEGGPPASGGAPGEGTPTTPHGGTAAGPATGGGSSAGPVAPSADEVAGEERPGQEGETK